MKYCYFVPKIRNDYMEPLKHECGVALIRLLKPLTLKAT